MVKNLYISRKISDIDIYKPANQSVINNVDETVFSTVVNSDDSQVLQKIS